MLRDSSRVDQASRAVYEKPAELEAVLTEVERLGLEWITVSKIRE